MRAVLRRDQGGAAASTRRAREGSPENPGDRLPTTGGVAMFARSTRTSVRPASRRNVDPGPYAIGARGPGHPRSGLQSGSYDPRPAGAAVGLAAGELPRHEPTDYGGGTPVVDVWRPGVGLMSDLGLRPCIYLPVSPDSRSRRDARRRAVVGKTLAPGERLTRCARRRRPPRRPLPALVPIGSS